MRRVLLVTIQNNSNFGNRLQNYALQSVLEDFGCIVENLSLYGVPLADMSIPDTRRRLKAFIKRAASSVGLKRFIPGISSWDRRMSCSLFSRKYIHNYLMLTRPEVENYDFGRFDAAITGSDQVWHNWNRIPDELSFYYLCFMPENRRISYAPSFGFRVFPREDIMQHQQGLLGMKSLSCREQEGCDIIYRLTGRKAQRVLDPTLLLPREKWEAMEERPSFKLPQKYMLQFMLGNVPGAYLDEIKRIAGLRDCQIIDIGNRQDFKKFGISPSEFIWLIHHADIVCTDSFHASVFSIVFEKSLRVFERDSPQMGNMFGRIYDLLVPLGLGRLLNPGDNEFDFSTKLSASAIDYLSNEKNASLLYLQNSLEMVP